MEAVGYILALALNGLIVGALARLAIPGPDPMSIIQTMLVGIAGSLIAGLITYYVFDESALPGLLIAFLCAAGIVFAIRKFRERQLGPAAANRQTAGLGGDGVQVRFMPGCLVGSLLASLFLTIVLNLLIRAF